MKLELIFGGTPIEFGYAVDLINIRYADRPERVNLEVITENLDSNPINVNVRLRKQGDKRQGLITAQRIPGGRSLLYLWAFEDQDWPKVMEHWTTIRSELREGWIISPYDNIDQAPTTELDKTTTPDKKRGPTAQTQDRFTVFKRIKDTHPDWSYVKVAYEAARELGDDGINEETVRNTYRALGVEWKRADRIR